nr:addiction module toxin RelE [Salinisphaera japonica]|tara:strand:- start:160 stop:501 length:342 start_codon:yes stop_codon:yes gene_type:complete
MQTVAETPEFARKIRKLVGDADYRALIAYLAEHPQAGDIMRGTGGIRKLRWARDGAGKSGGVRVIYYVHDERIPLYLLRFSEKTRKPISLKLNAIHLPSLSHCSPRQQEFEHE